MKSLQERIREGIVLATEASIRDAERTPPGAKPKPSPPSRPKPTEIPIVGDIAAGLGRIADENIEDYLLLGDNCRNGADFGVKVMGDSMKGHDILSGDIALIRQQPAIEMGEIAAVVVTTRTESEGTLKQYYRYEKRADMQHWFLKSSNPSSEHLVIYRVARTQTQFGIFMPRIFRLAGLEFMRMLS
jgi:SOS-response transcriptional repressor LexA